MAGAEQVKYLLKTTKGVCSSPSDEGSALAGTTAIGLESGPGMKELNMSCTYKLN